MLQRDPSLHRLRIALSCALAILAALPPGRALAADGTPLFAPVPAEAPMSAKQHEMMSLDMASRATMGVTMAAPMDSGAMHAAMTAGMNGLRDGATAPVLRLPLNATSSADVRRTSVTRSGDHYVWRGEIEGTGEPVTLLWWPDGHVSGQIRHGNRIFVVKPAGGNAHEIVEMSPKALPPDHAPASSELLQKMNMAADPLVRQGDASMMRSMMEHSGMMSPRKRPSDAEIEKLKDAPGGRDESAVRSRRPRVDQSATGDADLRDEVVITLLVAYTPAVARRYEDPARDLVALAVEEANQSFRNSGLGFIRLELAHAYETDYVESGSHFDHVWRFADKGDGYMDEVHALRDKYKADVAVLMVHDPVGCGLATRVAAEPDEAFAVVHHECATSMYSLAHEIGHIIGARHDYALDGTAAPFPYGHGYVHGAEWRTMMSYKDTCNDCPRLPVWSSPTVKIKGIPAGTDKHNNAKVLAEQAARVAGFR